jgi:hypothetical protein
MVCPEHKRYSKSISKPVETSRIKGIGAVSRSADHQKHPTPAAPATSGAIRIPGAVRFPSGQHHSLVQPETLKRRDFVLLFTSYQHNKNSMHFKGNDNP